MDELPEFRVLNKFNKLTNEYITSFGTLGLAYMVTIIGVKLSLSKKNKFRNENEMALMQFLLAPVIFPQYFLLASVPTMFLLRIYNPFTFLLSSFLLGRFFPGNINDFFLP